MSAILINPAELRKNRVDDNVVLFDCRFDLADKSAGRKRYLSGHIPEAVYADLSRDMSGEPTDRTGRHPLPAKEKFASFLRSAGVNNDTEIVVYDETSGPYAARMFWLCRRAGLARVRYLDGGYTAWLRQGFSVQRDVPPPRSGDFQIGSSQVVCKTMTEIKKNLSSGTHTLIDARDPARYRGVDDSVDPVAGCIPGAKNHFFALNITDAGYFKSPEQLKRQFQSVGSAVPEKTVHTCGSGVSACHNYLAMEIAGLRNSAVYAGSWSEWITDPTNPVEVLNSP